MGEVSAISPDPARHLPTAELVRRLLRDYLRTHAVRLSLAILCMMVGAGATAGNAWLMEPVLDDVFIDRDMRLLYLVPLAVFVLAVVKGTAGYLEAVQMEFAGQRIVSTLQAGMYARLMRADLAFFADTSSGKLISRFINDANMLRYSVVRSLTGIAKDALTLAFLVALMFHQDALLAMIAFIVFPGSIYPILLIGRRVRRVSADTQARIAQFTTLLDETFQGVRVVKAYGMERYETGRARSLLEAIFRLFWKAARVRSASRPLMETLGGVAAAAVIFYGGSQVIAGATTPGTFFSFLTAMLLAYQPLKSVANMNTTLQEGLAAAQRVFALLDIEPDVVDRAGARRLAVTAGRIAFDRVNFAYNGERRALDGVDLDVPAGRTVALVGPSGAGKSTVFNLIPRFYDVDEGAVLIDGADVRDVTLTSLRASIALVSQEITLFDDTVRANIAYGRPDAGEEELIAAARDAGAHDFIAALPRGYDTRVGGRGVKLSGGQRQRLAIARAMLKDAPILLLDEATSSLDAESEHRVQAALLRLKQGRTTLVIAHRLSTIHDADLIYVLQQGRIVETGSHGELLARRGAYARLHALQFADAGDRWDAVAARA